jgi:CheY-like chemotaxis protein
MLQRLEQTLSRVRDAVETTNDQSDHRQPLAELLRTIAAPFGCAPDVHAEVAGVLVPARALQLAVRGLLEAAADRTSGAAPTLQASPGSSTQTIEIRLQPWPAIDSLADPAAALAQATLAPHRGVIARAHGDTLRIEVPTDRHAPARPEPPVPARRLRVLVADDAPQNRRFAEWALAGRGHEVVTADDGAAAVERAAAWRPDIILMDLEVPVQDGISAASQILCTHEHAGTIAPPLIAVSAHDLQVMGEQCLRAGMVAFLGKPFPADQLVRVCEQHAGPPHARAPGPAPTGAPSGPRTRLPRWLADAYCRDLESSVAELRKAEGSDEVHRIAHRIAGAAATYGHTRLCEAARELEQAPPVAPLQAEALRRTLQAAADVLAEARAH